jgi:CubicO group peptidase (beta-lactamase class C family)
VVEVERFAGRGPRRPAVTPGTRWAYSNEGAQLLSPILDRAAGEPIQRYAERRLFGPLGLRDTRFQADARGHAATYANLTTTPRDLARIGVLVARHGRWQGRQLGPGALIDSLVRPSQPFEPRYGMLWWRLAQDGTVAYVTRGSLATNMYVFPAQDVVVVRMQSRRLPESPHLSYEPAALPLFRALLQAFAPAHWH